MIILQVIVGIINIILGLLIVMFRNSLSKSHFIVRPRAISGKSFEERYGTERGTKLMLLFGLFVLMLGFIVMITGILDVNITTK